MYGPRYLGWPATLSVTTASYLNCGSYILATACGLQRRLVGRRASELNDCERAEATRALETVLRTPVPGID